MHTTIFIDETVSNREVGAVAWSKGFMSWVGHAKRNFYNGLGAPISLKMARHFYDKFLDKLYSGEFP